MKIDELPVKKEIIQILKKQGIEKLYPPQAESVKSILEGKNAVLSFPTASGKSLMAYLAILNSLLKTETGKALYVVPLKALAREKYEELKEFEQLGLSVGISTGDLDDSDPRLSKFDIIVCTSEKADSLLRHKVNWINQINVLVVDEIHLIHDPLRGPTLEVIISHFKSLNPNTQIVGLSATIQNAMELSIWLDGKLFRSNWRPVPLREGVCYKHDIKFDDGKTKKVKGKEKRVLNRLVENSFQKGGQCLVFVNTRRSTIAVAGRLCSVINEKISDKEKKKLKQIVEQIETKLPEVTSVDKKLFSYIKKGVAFHHAGLSSIQRRGIENGFKNRLIKCIVATPTLAAGVNIPAQRVIIRDLWRYDPNYGMKPIPILEYKQQAGRAGRPGYDDLGEAISIAKKRGQKEQIFENYVLSETEPIFSKLGSQAALRMHLLSSIAAGFVENIEDVYSFIDSTFYAYQADTFALRDEINCSINFLVENGFVDKNQENMLMSTTFGDKTSSLYIDPLSALKLREALQNTDNVKQAEDISFLHAVCSTPDVRSLYLRKKDEWVEEKVEDNKDVFLIKPPTYSSNDYEWYLSDAKTSFLIKDWIGEKPEDYIVKKYNVGPGDIHNKVETVVWLLHAMREFARMYNFESVSAISDLKMRVEYGCRKELLNLVSLHGIGRVRARSLYNEGFKTITDLQRVPVKRLMQVRHIGRNIAESIKKQIGENIKKEDHVLSDY
ncbi:MAG: DEAD/DEAH box helicase [Candidatus Thermoplasmatota archaeon]